LPSNGSKENLAIKERLIREQVQQCKTQRRILGITAREGWLEKLISTRVKYGGYRKEQKKIRGKNT
jgi:hypothetical protein